MRPIYQIKLQDGSVREYAESDQGKLWFSQGGGPWQRSGCGLSGKFHMDFIITAVGRANFIELREVDLRD